MKDPSKISYQLMTGTCTNENLINLSLGAQIGRSVAHDGVERVTMLRLVSSVMEFMYISP